MLGESCWGSQLPRPCPAGGTVPSSPWCETLCVDTDADHCAAPPTCASLLPLPPSLLQGGSQSYTNYFADALTAEARRDSRIVGIHAAMGGGTGMNRFEKVRVWVRG